MGGLPTLVPVAGPMLCLPLPRSCKGERSLDGLESPRCAARTEVLAQPHGGAERMTREKKHEHSSQSSNTTWAHSCLL